MPTIGSLPDIFFTKSCTIVILVEPPTSKTPSMSVHSIFIDFNKLLQSNSVLSIKTSVISLNSSLVTVYLPLLPFDKIEIDADSRFDKSFFSFSTATKRSYGLSTSSRTFPPYSSLNWSVTYIKSSSSQSFPPSLWSPSVPRVSIPFLSIRTTVTSKVPPPRS